MWKFLTYFLYVLTVVFKAIVNKKRNIDETSLHRRTNKIRSLFFIRENRKPVRNEDGVSDGKVFQAE